MNIPLSRPDITALERTAVMNVLKTPHLSLGPRLDAFEKEAADFAGRKYAVAVNSGTSALHLIVKALGIGSGDEVVTSPFSFVASANCLLFEQARPVFADIDALSLNVDPLHVEAVFRKRRRKRIKAILAVDVFGHPADWDALYDIADRYEVKIIEDSCEALGALYRSPDGASRRRWKDYARAGSFGEASVFAFYPNKQITMGEGGLVLTDTKTIYRMCRSLRNQGREEGAGWFDHVRLGYNYRVSDINCALGSAQLARVEDILRRRSRVAASYTRKLRRIDGLVTPACRDNVTMSWFVYVVRLADRFTRRNRDDIIAGLRKSGIACSTYFAPIHLQPFYRKQFGFRRGSFPVTERVSDRTIALPFYSRLTREEISYVCENLERLVAKIG